MSHFLAVVVSDTCDIYNDLERYCEQTDDMDYLEFCNQTDELKSEYDSSIKAVKLVNGSTVEINDFRFSSLYTIKDNLIYKKRYGKKRIKKRTKKAKRMKIIDNYPLKKMYKTFDEFATRGRYAQYYEEEDAYGYYYNPEGFYDWCVIGGRWANQVLVKDSVEDVVEDDSLFRDREVRKAPKGYKWVCGARKSDVEWDMMKKMAIKEATKKYYSYKEIFESGKVKDIPLMRIEDDKLYYWSECVFCKGEKMKDYFIRKGLYNRKYFINCYACINSCDEWKSKGRMGMWAISLDEMNEEEWHKEVEKILTEADDQQYIIFLDCHI